MYINGTKRKLDAEWESKNQSESSTQNKINKT